MKPSKREARDDATRTKTRSPERGNLSVLLHDKSTCNRSFKMDEATPRITQQYLESFQHRTVRIIGRVQQLRGETATIDAGGQITVHLNRVSLDLCSLHWQSITNGPQDAHLTVDHAVEIVGKVQTDLSVRVLAATDFGTDIGEYCLLELASWSLT